MTRAILIYPDPRLKQVCAPVTAITENVRALADDLVGTMRAYPGSVGIAAPQVGELSRLIVVDVSGHKRAKEHHGLLVLVNPAIVSREGEQVGREGCLSIPDYTANIRRAAHVLVEAHDLENVPCRIEAGGFEAVVLQHEIDHLDGILFLDRVASIKSDLFRRKIYLPQPTKSKE